jgi:hypothetical protein
MNRGNGIRGEGNDMRRKSATMVIVLALLVGSISGCSEINREDSPVEMLATIEQDIDTIDLLNLPTTQLGTILLRAIQKRVDSDPRFLDVELIRYQVSYRRTDGGSLVPASFVRTISGTVPVGGGPTTFNTFTVFDIGSLQQAPYAALLPQNGGRDPETGNRFVKMDVIIDVFGETISGERVSARAQAPFTFCAGCS